MSHGRTQTWRRAGVGLALLLVSACSEAVSPETCRRYDNAALVPDRGFSVLVDRTDLPRLDDGADRIELSMLFAQQPTGPVELVHMVDGREVGRWSLRTPLSEHKFAAFVTCWIAPHPGASNCGAFVDEVPHAVGGYYYLSAGTASLVEAGLAFYVCN